MRFVFNYEELVNVNVKMSTIADKDSATVLMLGGMEIGDKILCQFRTTTTAEEIFSRLLITKPEGFDGNCVTKAVRSQLFGGLISSLSAFKEDIFIDVEGDEVKVGNSTTVVPVPVLSNIPQGMNDGSQETPYVQMAVNGNALSAFIRRALECTDPKDTTCGFSNAIICVNTVNGNVRGLSTEGHVIAYATMESKIFDESCIPEGTSEEKRKQTVASLNAMKASLEAHCKEVGQTTEGVYLLFPTGAVQHLKKLVGKDVVQFAFDKRRVYVSLDGNQTQFTFVQGRDRKVDFTHVEAMLKVPSSASVQLDAAGLLRSVDFVNGTSKITCSTDELTPLKIEFAKGQLVLSSGKDFSIKNIVKANAVNGEGTDVLVSGDWLKSRLEALDKGGACVSVVGGTIMLTNGTLDKQSEYKSFLGLINPEQWNKQESAESEAKADNEPAAETTESDDSAA